MAKQTGKKKLGKVTSEATKPATEKKATDAKDLVEIVIEKSPIGELGLGYGCGLQKVAKKDADILLTKGFALTPKAYRERYED